jgi:hypothetical protein
MLEVKADNLLSSWGRSEDNPCTRTEVQNSVRGHNNDKKNKNG